MPLCTRCAQHTMGSHWTQLQSDNLAHALLMHSPDRLLAVTDLSLTSWCRQSPLAGTPVTLTWHWPLVDTFLMLTYTTYTSYLQAPT